MSLVEHTKHELEILKSMNGNGDYDGMIEGCLLSIIELIASQGHSGYSLSSLTYNLNRLLKFKPLTELTGKEDEWVDVGNGMLQNKRMPSVFKENGNAYDIDKISSIEDGMVQQYITFPHYPL